MSLGWDSHPLLLCTAQGRSCGSERSLVALAAPGVGMSQVLILVLPSAIRGLLLLLHLGAGKPLCAITASKTWTKMWLDRDIVPLIKNPLH